MFAKTSAMGLLEAIDGNWTKVIALSVNTGTHKTLKGKITIHTLSACWTISTFKRKVEIKKNCVIVYKKRKVFASSKCQGLHKDESKYRLARLQ